MKKLLLLFLVLLGGITQVSATTYKVTVIDGKGWISGSLKMCAYMWNSSDDSKRNADFPGAEMASNGTRTINGVACNVYTYTIESSETFNKVIFAVSDKSHQSGTLDYSENMECTLYSDHDVYLINNISGWSDKSPSSYSSKGVWDGTQDVYQFTVTASALTTNQFQCRPKASDWSDEMSPNSSSYSFDFSSNGQWNSYDSYSNNEDYKNTGRSFIIDHPNINAAEYKITVYIKYESWGRKYTTKAEIVSMPVTLAAEKGTFCCDRALNFSGTGIDAYLITGASGGVLTASSALTNVPANTPLYLEGSAGTVNVPVVETSAASEVDTSANLLKKGTGSAVASTETISETSYTNFILTNQTTTNNSAPLRFYKANDNTVPVNKAYLQISSATVGAREFVWFEDDMTGIEKVSVDTKAFNGAVYNLAGQRVAQPTKGLYIVNGKKVVLK